jgi:hypothetical protein
MLEETAVATVPAPASEEARGGRWVVLPEGGRRFWSRDDVAHGVTLTGRALVNLGVKAEGLVAVSLADVEMAMMVVAGAEAVGAEAVRLPDTASLAEWRPQVWMTDIFSALSADLPDSVTRVIVTADAAVSRETVARLKEHAGRPLEVGQMLWLPEVPGPVAISCREGRLHFTEDGIKVRLLALDGDGEASPRLPARLQISDTRPRLAALPTWSPEIWVEAAACNCGMEDGPVAARVLGRSRLTVAGTVVYPADVCRALFRTPGFGGGARLAVTRDRGRGKEFLAVTATAEPGQEMAALQEALNYSLAALVKVPVRVQVRSDDELRAVEFPA